MTVTEVPSRPEARRRRLNVAVVGATGAVGAEAIQCLESRGFPVASLRLLASARSAGRSMTFKGQPVAIEALGPESFDGVDLAIFAASADIAREHAPIAVAAGCTVIDNSSAFRMDPQIALVVPEVNGHLLQGAGRLIANPNCVAAIAVMALQPLHQLSPIVRLVAATYQAASGAGAEAMAELRDSTAAWLEGRDFPPQVLPHPYAFNLFSHNDAVDPATGYNGEETKAMAEVRKILSAPDMAVSFTCIRVPVLRAHSMALTVTFERAVSVEAAVAAFEDAPGVRLVNDMAANRFPMPVEATGGDDVLVGRIRTDLSDPSGRTLSIFVAGDQLRKGAALNAVQIAEAVMT